MRSHSRAAMPIPLSATAKITQPSWHDARTEIRLSRPVYLQRCRAGSAARQQGRPGRPTAAAGRDSPRPRHAAPVHAAVRAQLPSKAAAVKAMARYLAVLVYRMLTKGEAWVDRGAARFEQKRSERELASLRSKAFGERVPTGSDRRSEVSKSRQGARGWKARERRERSWCVRPRPDGSPSSPSGPRQFKQNVISNCASAL